MRGHSSGTARSGWSPAAAGPFEGLWGGWGSSSHCTCRRRLPGTRDRRARAATCEASAFCGQRISLAPTYPFSPRPAFLSPHPASPTIPTLPGAAPRLQPLPSDIPAPSLDSSALSSCTQPTTPVLHPMCIPAPNPASFVHALLALTLLQPLNSPRTPTNVLAAPSCSSHSGQHPRPSSPTHA